MANYSLVVNSKFQPFSFGRYIQPYQIYGQAYKDIENQYAELATKANVWEEMANEQTDPYAYKMYKTYSNDLEEQAGQLAREGLTPASRQNMLKMRQRYSSDIIPIENAYKRRQELIDEQRKLTAQDNTMMFDRNASMLSLDDLIRNPQLTYQSYSGATLAKQVGTAAQNLAKEMRENPRKWRRILGNQYFETIMQKGYRPEEIIQVLQNDPNASSVLKGIIEDAIGNSNIASWGDQATLNRAYNYARQGLWNAIGETQYQTLQNQEYLNPLQKLQYNKLTTPTINNLAINPLNIYSSKEINPIGNNIKNYSKYFKKNDEGNVELTEEGLKEYNRTEDYWKSASGWGSYKDKGPSKFKIFLDSIGGPDNWENYQKSHSNKTYDATRVTEFDYPIASAQQSDMKDAIMTANRGLTLKEVDYDSKSESFKDTGEELSIENLNKNEYKVTATRFSPYGNTVMIQDDKGNVKRYRMPAGINTTNEQNRDAMMSWAKVLQNNRNGGVMRIPDDYAKLNNIPIGTTITATPEQVMNEYNRTLQEAYLFHSQLGVQNKTKEQEYYPYSY